MIVVDHSTQPSALPLTLCDCVGCDGEGSYYVESHERCLETGSAVERLVRCDTCAGRGFVVALAGHDPSEPDPAEDDDDDDDDSLDDDDLDARPPLFVAPTAAPRAA